MNSFSVVPILGVCFIVLKLCNVISWGWIWVLAPFWIGIAGGIVTVISVLIFTIAQIFLSAYFKKNKKLWRI
jgi:hypothetical protein